MIDAPSRRELLAASLALVCCPPCDAQGTQAQGTEGYPNKPIRIVVPYAPGAINDVLARAVADRLQVALGQPVIVENRAGAGAVIGTQSVAGAAPDGYTLLQMPAAHAINATLVPKLGYDSLRSFSFITLAARSPFLLVASQEFPARSVPELVALAKAKPGTYAFASPGNGSTAHLMGEMLKSMARIEVLHVPYKGTGPALTDLIGGVVHFTFSTYPGASAALKAGRVRVLAVTGKSRWPVLPEVPTIAESGYPSYDATGWWG
jgi:tripartite-type tricarboxylate transporter receptor subunit TctC